MHSFKLYGIFRSGTNLLKLLIEQNMAASCRFNIGGHKHLYTPLTFGPDGYERPDEDVIVCVKDPYASMASLFKYAEQQEFRHFECGRTWENFLQSRFVIAIDREPRPPAFWFRSPVDYWNSHYFHMLSLPPSRAMIVRYEDVLSDPLAVLRSISAKFPAANLTSDDITIPAKAVRRMGEVMPDNPLTDQPFERDWYEKRRYLYQYSPEQLAFIETTLDTDVLAQLGYKSAQTH